MQDSEQFQKSTFRISLLSLSLVRNGKQNKQQTTLPRTLILDQARQGCLQQCSSQWHEEQPQDMALTLPAGQATLQAVLPVRSPSATPTNTLSPAPFPPLVLQTHNSSVSLEKISNTFLLLFKLITIAIDFCFQATKTDTSPSPPPPPRTQTTGITRCLKKDAMKSYKSRGVGGGR